jgi:three-Cys-motif partner protein
MSHRVFIFIEHDQQNAGSLQAEIDAFQAQRQPWPANVKTEVVHGTFDRTATEILEQLRAQKANLAPTFAFVDPFGYSGLPMKLLAELLAYPKTELFVDEVLKDWEPADVGRVEHLRAVYERQLKAVALIGRWRGQADTFSWDAGLEADGEFVECDADPLVQTTVDAESEVAASQVLHERPPSGDDLQ